MWKLSIPADPGAAVGLVAAVDAAEAQRLLADVELVEAGQAGADDDVALLAELVRPAAALVEHGAEELLGVGPQLVEALVGPVDVGLFRLELRMRCHSRSLSTAACAVNHRSYRPGMASAWPRRAIRHRATGHRRPSGRCRRRAVR